MSQPELTSMGKDDPTTLRFASQLLPSPPNAPPATPSNLDLESAVALYSHAVLLFHAYSWHQSIKYHRSILRRDVGGLLPAAHLWFNIAIIRCHLGEYALAVEAFDKATEHDPDLAVAWFCMGIALFQLQDYRRAERRFKKCLACLGSDVVLIDYRPQGLKFSLEKTRIEFNIRLCLLWKLHTQVKADKPPPWSLNRMPAGLLFEHEEKEIATTPSKESIPSEAEDRHQDELHLPLVPESSTLRTRPKGILTLFRRRAKGDKASKRKPSPPPKTQPSGPEVRPPASPALYIPTYQGPPLPPTQNSDPTDSIGRHQRTDSFAIIAPETTSGRFEPLPPLPPPPIGSNTPSPRASFIEARRQSALAMLNGEHPYSTSAPPDLGGGGGVGIVRRRTRPSPLHEESESQVEVEVRDSLAIFAMGVLEDSERDRLHGR